MGPLYFLVRCYEILPPKREIREASREIRQHWSFSSETCESIRLRVSDVLSSLHTVCFFFSSAFSRQRMKFGSETNRSIFAVRRS